MNDVRLMGTTDTGESVPVLVSPQGEVIVDATPLTAQAPLKVSGPVEAPEITIDTATADRPGAMTADQARKLTSIEDTIPHLRTIHDSYSNTETDTLLSGKRDVTDSYSKAEVDAKVAAAPSNLITVPGFAITAGATATSNLAIPAGVKQITLQMAGIGLSSLTSFVIQVGGGTSVQSTGYNIVYLQHKSNNTSTINAITNGIALTLEAQAATLSGELTFTQRSGAFWLVSGQLMSQDPMGLHRISGRIQLTEGTTIGVVRLSGLGSNFTGGNVSALCFK